MSCTQRPEALAISLAVCRRICSSLDFRVKRSPNICLEFLHFALGGVHWDHAKVMANLQLFHHGMATSLAPTPAAINSGLCALLGSWTSTRCSRISI